MGGSTEVRLLSTLALMGVVRTLAPRFEQDSGVRVAASFAPTADLLKRIAQHEAADLAILTDEAVQALAAAGTLVPLGAGPLARSSVGVAVRAGAPRPDIGSIEAFASTLLRARSVAYSRAGASGIFFARLLDRLGIAAEVNAKASIIPAGLTGELVARGEAELAIQQISELLCVPGLDIVGPLPPGIENRALFTVARFAAVPPTPAAEAFLARLLHPGTDATFAETGLERLRPPPA